MRFNSCAQLDLPLSGTGKTKIFLSEGKQGNRGEPARDLWAAFAHAANVAPWFFTQRELPRWTNRNSRLTLGFDWWAGCFFASWFFPSTYIFEEPYVRYGRLRDTLCFHLARAKPKSKPKNLYTPTVLAGTTCVFPNLPKGPSVPRYA